MKTFKHFSMLVTRAKQLIQISLLLAGLLASLQGNSQHIEAFEQFFRKYTQHLLQEKLYVHTDKQFYLAGDLVWCKLYNVAASTHQPLPLSKLAYLELIDANNHPALQTKIHLDSGLGNTAIQLPVTIASGNYKLRAYTSFMKNLGTDYLFEKMITIVNTQKRREPAETKASTPEIRFFPEGGNLVYGIPSRVACKVSGADGKGEDFSGTIVDGQNNTIAKFQSAVFGMGSFEFTPQAGQTYKAVIATSRSSYTLELPKPFGKGYVMQVNTANANILEVTVRTNIAEAKELYFTVHTHQSLKLVKAASVQNGVARFQVAKNMLGDGISNLTVFNTAKQPVCERLYFKYPEAELHLRVSGNDRSYSPRSLVSLGVTAATEHALPADANVSVSVFQVTDLQQAEENDIHSYLWLASDLNGYIESPGYYFTNKNAKKEAEIDNLMLTHGWRRFRWEDILNGEQPKMHFPLEYNGHIVIGKVVNSITGKPMPGVGVFASHPGPGAHFRATTSDSLGVIKFEFKKVQGTNELVVQPSPGADSMASVEIHNPFLEHYSNTPLPPLRLLSSSETLLHNYHIGTQTQNVYERTKRTAFPSWHDTTAFYGKPDASYMLDDYTRFTTMEEVMREYVSFMNVIKTRNGFNIRLWDIPSNFAFETAPLLLVDGVSVRDINKLFAFDPMKMRKLEIVNRRYLVGTHNFPGIMSWSTYKGDLAGYELDPKAVVIDYPGLELQREFYSPQYDSPEKLASRIPDFRNVLYWSPEMRVANGKRETLRFYTSDVKGKFMALLQGLSTDGRSGIATVEFEVK